MPRRSTKRAPTRSRKSASSPTADDFAAALGRDLGKVQAAVAAEERTEAKDLGHRSDLNRRILQDLWEVHNRFEQVSVHLTLEPAATLFATFAEYPTQFTLRENFDFGALTSIELADRAQGWLGYGLRFWYYRDGEGRGRFRGIFEWTEGESYHRYAGWMRTINQAVIVDSFDHEVDVAKLQSALREIAVKWYGAHLNRTPSTLVEFLKGHFPAGASYTKESYR